jgi:pimeloyl-ACP methyl ester carboxylesterase
MSDTQTMRDWSDEERRAVRAQLDLMAADDLFSGAPRLIALLRYLVEAALAGDTKALGQLSIATEVLGRGEDFDPSVDSAVRVEAGRLRARLREYNAGDRSAEAVTLTLPKGRYQPHIEIGPHDAVELREPAVQAIRFLKTADDVSIAYSTCGSGPPLIKAANWLSHLEYDFESPVWRHWWQELGNRYTLVRYDERGCGLSDWDVDEFNVEAWVRDLEAVTDQVGHERFALLGISQGASVAALYALRHPERVSHLVLYGGFARGAFNRDLPPDLRAEREMLLQLTGTSWGSKTSLYRKVFGSLFIPDGTQEEFEAFEALQRYSTSPENARRFMEAFYNLDVVAELGKITTPTLVMHARDDIEITKAESKLLAKSIPNARLALLDSNRHILGAHEPAWQEFLRELDEFLAS